MVVRQKTAVWLRPEFWLCLWLTLVASLGHAENELNVTVDRSKIHQQDTLNLKVVGTTSKSVGFGGLFSFSTGNVDAPDFTPLQQDFEILDQSQSYNMQTINGRSRTEVSWSLVLSPKRSGTLTIPALSYENSTSTPLTVEVLPGKAPRDSSRPPLVFLEVEVDKANAYVQEQILFTLRLYSSEHLDSGDLSSPTHPDLIVENFGETQKYYRMAYNQRYEVRERQYLLFAQKSGPLTITPQHFNGTLVDTQSRRRLRVNESSDPVQLEIKPPPASFTGKHWLPATSLTLTETWDKEPFDIEVGDSHTRTLQIQALGLLGSALPPLSVQDIAGIKRYPDKPSVESFQHDSGAKGLRKETTAWVAVAPGSVEIPEVRLAWWDTVNDVERVEVIPGRSIAILASPDSAQPSTAASDTSSASQDAGSPAATESESPGPSQQFWYALTTLLALGWISSTFYLLRRVPRAATSSAMPIVVPSYQTLLSAIEQDQSAMPLHLIRWAQSMQPERNIRSIEDLQKWDQILHTQAKAFETALYGKNRGNPSGQPNSYDRHALLARVKALAKTKPHKLQDNSLKAFYPSQPG